MVINVSEQTGQEARSSVFGDIFIIWSVTSLLSERKFISLHSIKLDPGLTSQFIELAADVFHQVDIEFYITYGCCMLKSQLHDFVFLLDDIQSCNSSTRHYNEAFINEYNVVQNIYTYRMSANLFFSCR